MLDFTSRSVHQQTNTLPTRVLGGGDPCPQDGTIHDANDDNNYDNDGDNEYTSDL